MCTSVHAYKDFGHSSLRVHCSAAAAEARRVRTPAHCACKRESATQLQLLVRLCPRRTAASSLVFQSSYAGASPAVDTLASRSCPCRTAVSSLVSRTSYAGANPATDAALFSAVISGETPIVSVNSARGPFVRRERMQGSIPSTATRPISSCHRSMDGTHACEACWLRFKSSRWHQRADGARLPIQLSAGREDDQQRRAPTFVR